MLTLEDRQRLRALATPELPQRDLWPDIAARIESPPRTRRSHMARLALAASLAGVAILSGALGIRMLHNDGASRIAGTSAKAITHIAAAGNAATRWNPADPRLRGAAIELHAAQGELQQALAMAPRSAYLQRLLHDTRNQQARLRRLDLDAG